MPYDLRPRRSDTVRGAPGRLGQAGHVGVGVGCRNGAVAVHEVDILQQQGELQHVLAQFDVAHGRIEQFFGPFQAGILPVREVHVRHGASRDHIIAVPGAARQYPFIP